MVSDYGKRQFLMEKIAISKFKATCLSVLERVRRTRRPILVTRFGEPIAEVVPPSTAGRSQAWIGALSHTGRVRGDIVAPATNEREWETLHS